MFDEYEGEETPVKSPVLSFFHSSSPITLSGWHITQMSTQGPKSEAQINSMCHQNSQISLCGCIDEYKGDLTPLKSSIVSYFQSSYPVNLFRWQFTHLLPHGTPSEAQINSMFP